MAYTIEEEQELNELKEWWKENGKLVILAFVVGIAGVVGWRFWQNYQVNQIMAASSDYSELARSATADGKATHAKVEQFVQAHDKTSYAVFALLDEAKGLVAQKDYARAEQSLQQALNQSQDEVLRALASLRLGALQLQLGKLDAALNTLSAVKADAFIARKALLEGDVQLAKSDSAAAKSAFELAVQKGTPAEQQLARMKLNNL
ncbi:YfgM family protein [uncultured Haemophilus sp.]|uniref:YfgM family protein n=1 Tax=uncultured Haemophilus sp. TaxID=237779 RepID=UPI002806356A|nr:YfgM family protein [uncultured Haemophilus sp.]